MAILFVGAATLAGCSSAPIVDAIPTAVGGLPEGVPQRPTMPQTYPAVHDMPPARGQATLNAAENNKLREELAATRERTARHAVESEETTASVPDDSSKGTPKGAPKGASKGASKGTAKSAPKGSAAKKNTSTSARAAGSTPNP